MIWLLIAIISQIILGTAAVFDKLLLQRRVPDPVVYTFWIGLLGTFSALLLPFGFFHIPAQFIFLDLISGIIFLCSLLILYLALAQADAASTLTLAAAFTPLWTLPFAALLIGVRLSFMDIIGMSLLIIGAFLFFCAGEKKLRMRLTLLVIASAALYGLSSVLQKIVFEHSNFVMGFFWAKMGEVLCALCFLALPYMRKRIFNARVKMSGQNGIWYLANRSWAAIGSMLLSLAVFLSHPALVQSTQSFRYAVIFVASWLILRERSHGKSLMWKIGATFLIALGILWLSITDYARNIPYDPNRTITWGITFSDEYSRDKLGLDWKENFNAIINQLHPKKMRLIAYWDEIEKEHGTYDFSHLDWELDRARGQGIQIVLVLGMKAPRWPECHIPTWTEQLMPEDRETFLRDYIPHLIERYRNHPEIAAWQVENEPFLKFGLCATRGTDFLDKEIALVRSLDLAHPIVVTDGGEFGLWTKAIRAGDIFGTTMYRRVYPPSTGRYVGVIDYPLSPSFFRFKQKLMRMLTGEQAKPFIVIELQAEPWGSVEAPLLSYKEQINIFSPDYFHETIEYARQTGFDEYYLWGSEWWYYVGIKQGNWMYWDEVRDLINKSHT